MKPEGLPRESRIPLLLSHTNNCHVRTLEIKTLFKELVSQQADMSMAVVGIAVLTQVIKKSNGECVVCFVALLTPLVAANTMMELNDELKLAGTTLQVRCNVLILRSTHLLIFTFSRNYSYLLHIYFTFTHNYSHFLTFTSHSLTLTHCKHAHLHSGNVQRNSSTGQLNFLD